jgi:hypothetical protein
LFAVTAFSFALNTSVAAYSPAPFVRPGDSYRPLKTVRPILGAAFRLILRFHVRFMAKYRATFGSSCQFRLCSSARRKPKTGAVLASAPVSGSAALRGLTAPPCAQPLAAMKRMRALQNPRRRNSPPILVTAKDPIMAIRRPIPSWLHPSVNFIRNAAYAGLPLICEPFSLLRARAPRRS